MPAGAGEDAGRIQGMVLAPVDIPVVLADLRRFYMHEFTIGSAMRKTDAASIALVAWMLLVSGLLYHFHVRDLKLFLALTLVGFFITIYTIHPVFSRPRYIRNIRRMAIAGVALFGLVICLRILELVEYWSL